MSRGGFPSQPNLNCLSLLHSTRSLAALRGSPSTNTAVFWAGWLADSSGMGGLGDDYTTPRAKTTITHIVVDIVIDRSSHLIV